MRAARPQGRLTFAFVVGGDYHKYIQNTYKKLEK